MPLAADRPVYRYREDVLAELWTYGVRPTAHTPPELVRGFINEIYKVQLRKLRDRYVGGAFPKREYHRLVIEIRDRYPVLALRPRQWLRND
ncbi:MAG TPA: hypothetical protein VLV86_19925 [Vicinamibacterales bacterium]|nr:hypothetical protein [Vicinamibacterales bacterium]